jgi:hypothetical protein
MLLPALTGWTSFLAVIILIMQPTWFRALSVPSRSLSRDLAVLHPLLLFHLIPSDLLRLRLEFDHLARLL